MKKNLRKNERGATSWAAILTALLAGSALWVTSVGIPVSAPSPKPASLQTQQKAKPKPVKPQSGKPQVTPTPTTAPKQTTTAKLSAGSAGVVTTVAGNGTRGDTNGPAASAQFRGPNSLVADTAGNIYLTENGQTNRIRKIAVDGTVSTYAGTGDFDYKDGPATQAAFNNPSGIAIDAAGNLYIADTNNHAIRKVAVDGTVSTLAGGKSNGYVDGIGTAAKFTLPQSIVLSPDGNLYISDTGNNTIRKVTLAGVVTTVAGNPTAGYADGTGTAAAFNNPRGIAADSAGNLYVGDYNNYRIRKITPSGVVTSYAGDGTGGWVAGTETTKTSSEFSQLAVDAEGNVYYADNYNSIRKVDSSGTISLIAGNNSSVNAVKHADGTGTDARFYGPKGITVASDNSLLVTEWSGSYIRRIV